MTSARAERDDNAVTLCRRTLDLVAVSDCVNSDSDARCHQFRSTMNEEMDDGSPTLPNTEPDRFPSPESLTTDRCARRGFTRANCPQTRRRTLERQCLADRPRLRRFFH